MQSCITITGGKGYGHIGGYGFTLDRVVAKWIGELIENADGLGTDYTEVFKHITIGCRVSVPKKMREEWLERLMQHGMCNLSIVFPGFKSAAFKDVHAAEVKQSKDGRFEVMWVSGKSTTLVKEA